MPDNPVWLNDQAATKMGLKVGDVVGFINQDGIKSRTTTVVKTTPGICHDSVYMAHGYGSSNPLMCVGVDAGVDDTSRITKITVDPETGALGKRQGG